MQKTCETIFLNGSILTMDEKDRKCEAVAICENKISFVGTTAEAQKRIRQEDRVIELGGRSLIPGFNDAHCHFGYAGTAKLQAYVGYPEVKSVADLKRVVASWAQKIPKGQWIVGRGWDEAKYPDRKGPTRWDLDEVAPDHLVFLTRTCGHMSVVNSRVLSAQGIDRNTPDPHGGRIERDSRGELTGLLLEHAHIPIRTQLAPSVELLEIGLETTNKEFMQKGITSATDMSGRNVNEFRLFQRKLAAGQIHFRMNFAVRNSGEIVMGTNYVKTGLVTDFGSPWLRLGCFKGQMDGSASGGSAAMWTPYPDDPRNCGVPHMTQEELDRLVMEGHEAGYQVCVHAVGTKAIDMVLVSYERALKKIPRKNHRFRIEHCSFCDDSLAKRIRDLEVIAVIAPSFLHWIGDGFINKCHQDWLDWAVPGRRLLDRGVKVAFHSDMPVVPCDPFAAMVSAVTRKTMSGQEIGPSQGISVREAIRAYTIGSAYASFEEGIKGSIEVGKLADLVVLSADIEKIPAASIKDLRVDLTMVDGVIRYAQTV
ncbi:MAG: amidohydrolase [Deltaproteobacteria bacterium]|nr:amidohydrolase [Deltaproteobacteria bacterium]